MSILSFFLNLVGLYLTVGFLFALMFVIIGVGKIDPSAKEGTWGFRLLILPGTVALWPLLAWRWARGQSKPPLERNTHRREAIHAAQGESS